MSANGFPPRPALRWHDVTTTLADFAIVTFAVDPHALARHLPPDCVPDVFTLDDGSRRALVSAVPFRDLDFHFRGAPWARFAFAQTNYRAYVTWRGERCVFFFGTSLATPLVFLPRYVWKLPWHRDRISIEAAWGGERCERYVLETSGAWGEASASLVGTDEPMGRLDGFASEEETVRILTHPLVGHYVRRDGRRGTYAVWHDRLRLRRGHAERARFRVFEALGLVAPDAHPHSVLLQREMEFDILLPPRMLP